jgi:hypothetical protein
MPESHNFCTDCGGEHSEDLSDSSATQSDTLTGLGHKIRAFYGRNGRVTPKVRILLTAAIVVVLIGGIVAVAASGSGTPSNPYAQFTRHQQQFLYDLNDNFSDDDFVNAPISANALFVSEGNAVCTDFNQGSSVSEVFQDAKNAASNYSMYGITGEDMWYLAGAAIIDLCPKYIPLVQEYLGNSAWGIHGVINGGTPDGNPDGGTSSWG